MMDDGSEARSNEWLDTTDVIAPRTAATDAPNPQDSPVSRLPNEVLALIFEARQQACTSGSPKDRIRRSHRWLREVTHVCCRWRAVALAMTSLWTAVTISDRTEAHDRVRGFLLRSRSSPLSVTLSVPVCTRDGPLELILAEMPRIKTINILFTREYRPMNAFSGTSALETINVHSDLPPSKLPAEALDLFRPADLPRLRYIELYQVLFPRATALFKPTVTHLSVQLERWLGEHGPQDCTVEELLKKLHSMPLLRNLVLRKTVPRQSSANQPTAVTLPSLVSFVLEDCPKSCLTFLRSITAPVLEQVTVKAPFSLLDEGALGAQVLAATSAHLRSAQPVGSHGRCFRTMAISVSPHSWSDDVSIQLWTCPVAVDTIISARHPPPSLDFFYETQDFMLFLHAISTAPDLEGITALYIQSDERVSNPQRAIEWSTLCESFTAVRELGLSGTIKRVVVPLLSCQASHTQQKTPGFTNIVRFPSLVRLVVHNSDIQYVRAPVAGGRVSEFWGPLTLRSGEGYRLDNLSLVFCGKVARDVIGRLKEEGYVGDVSFSRCTPSA